MALLSSSCFRPFHLKSSSIARKHFLAHTVFRVLSIDSLLSAWPSGSLTYLISGSSDVQPGSSAYNCRRGCIVSWLQTQ